MCNDKIMPNDWNDFFQREVEKDYFKKLKNIIEGEYEENVIFPPKEDIFNAFKTTPLSQVKVVILGQDPYHTPGYAHGLSFSTSKGTEIPRSLSNIYKELNREYGYEIPTHGCLIEWAKQGVLLLNTILTVQSGKPNSHSKLGWEIFTDNVIKELNKQEQPIVFLLWGKNAEKKKDLLTNKNHLVLITSHPSPFSVKKGFDGCNHFKITNNYLKTNNEIEINWQII